MKKLTPLLILLIGCNQKPTELAFSDLAPTNKPAGHFLDDTNDPFVRYSIFTNSMIFLANRVEDTRTLALRLGRADIKATEFNVGDQKGFQFVGTKLGGVPITIDEASPYLNGTKLKLLIGNPFAMPFDAEIEVGWEQGGKHSIKSKTSSSIVPGRWSTNEVIPQASHRRQKFSEKPLICWASDVRFRFCV